MRTDIEIAREATLRPILEIAETLGLAAGDLHLYGHHIAKLPLSIMDRYRDQPDIVADELTELLGRDLPQPLEAGGLGVVSQPLPGQVALALIGNE